jgi:hypothetical protein
MACGGRHKVLHQKDSERERAERNLSYTYCVVSPISTCWADHYNRRKRRKNKKKHETNRFMHTHHHDFMMLVVQEREGLSVMAVSAEFGVVQLSGYV